MCHVCRHVLQEIKLFFIQKQDCNSHKLKNISQSGVSHGTGHTCHELALRHIWCEVFELTRAMYVATYSQEMKLFFIQKRNCNFHKLKKTFHTEWCVRRHVPCMSPRTPKK